MLNAFRRHAYSWFIRGVLFLIVVVFAFWGIGTGLFSQVHPVASVDGQRILADEVDREATQMRRNLQQLYGANAAEVLKQVNLRQEALEQLIERQLIRDEARRIGLEVSDDDLQARISANRAFQVDGQFDFATYEAVLRDNDLSPADFERSERQAMMADLLRQMVEQGVQVSDNEARFDFNQRNAKLALAYVELPAANYAGKIAPTEKQVEDYYKKNSERFREPERVKIAFVAYDPSTLSETVNPSDKEIQDSYNRDKATKFTHPFQVRARHILISVPAGATDQEKADAKAKAEDILKRVQAHPADFARLAEQYSDDTGNKFKGGDLGFFGKGEMVKPFEDAAFKLKPGDVTLVETQFGYHILKVEESRPAHVETLAEARPEIIESLRRKAGADIARRALHEDLTAALAGQDLKQLASKRGLEAVETPFFAADEPVKGADKNPEFGRQAFRMEQGDIRTITVRGDSYLVKMIQRQPSRIPPLKEIEAKVSAAFVQEQAQRAAREAANDLLKQIKTADDFDRVAAANKLEIRKTGEFSRAGATIPEVGSFPEVTDAAGTVAKIPGVIDRVMQHGGDAYIFEVLSRQPPDDQEWKKDGSSFTERIVEARRERAWSRFLDGLKERARITIDTNQLAQGGTESSM